MGTILAMGQPKNPVSWDYQVKKKTVDTYEVILTATVEDHWHIYSQKTGKGGPIPTNVSFKTNPLISKLGTVKEIGKLEVKLSVAVKTSKAVPPINPIGGSATTVKSLENLPFTEYRARREKDGAIWRR